MRQLPLKQMKELGGSIRVLKELQNTHGFYGQHIWQK